MFLIDLKVFFDGVWKVEPPDYYYEGGKVGYCRSINPKTFTFKELESIIRGFSDTPVSKYHYRVPGKPLKDGLILFWDGSFSGMVELGQAEEFYLEIYVEHEKKNTGFLQDINDELDTVNQMFDCNVRDDNGDVSDEDVASLDHVSECEAEELVQIRQQNLDAKQKKIEKLRVRRKGKEPTECNENDVVNENNKELNDSDSCGSDIEEESDCDALNEEEKQDFLEELRACSKAVDTEAFASDYEDSDFEFDLPNIDSDDEDAIQELNQMKWPVFNPKTKWKEQEPSGGMLFRSAQQFRHCITNYGVAKKRDIWFEKSGKKVLIARCREGCEWRCYASIMQMEERIQVKSYNPVHTQPICESGFRCRLVNSRWLAKEYANHIRANPKWDLHEFKALVKKKHEVTVSLNQCYKARQFALAEVEEVLTQHYAKLWDYQEELKRSNPGSTIILEGKDSEDGSFQIFDKMYICFAALREGWKAGCRPVVGLDGCFLKSFVSGEVLCAVGRDGNNHMFPIAWAVVDIECTETWTWFMKLLKQDLGTVDGHGLTFISDEQKGLLNGLKSVFPAAEHRNCARHIYANFRKHFSGENMRNLFWEAAKCSTEVEFLAKMEEIKKSSKKAYQYLMGHRPETWCRGFFSTLSCCDNVENNLSETFNSFILAARRKPMIRMLEDIRQALMVRLVEKRDFFLKCEDRICPKIRAKLNKSKIKQKDWIARSNGAGKFEVRKGLEGYSVDLEQKVCTCRMWQLGGYPCPHTVCAIDYINKDCNAYVNHWFTVEQTLKAYDYPLMPVNGQNLWHRIEKQPLMPPLKRRGMGRPKKDRYRELGEKGRRFRKRKAVENKVNPNEITRVGRQMRCTNCNILGHSARYCKNERVEGDPELDKRRRRQRKRKVPTDEQNEDDGVNAEDGVNAQADAQVNAQADEVDEHGQEAPQDEVGPLTPRETLIEAPQAPQVFKIREHFKVTSDACVAGPSKGACKRVPRKSPIKVRKSQVKPPVFAPKKAPVDPPILFQIPVPDEMPRNKRPKLVIKRNPGTVPCQNPKLRPLSDYFEMPVTCSAPMPSQEMENEKPKENVNVKAKGVLGDNGKSKVKGKGKDKTDKAVVKKEDMRQSYRVKSIKWNKASAEYQKKNEGVVTIDSNSESESEEEE